MTKINRQIHTASNVFRAKTLRIIYFENSVLGRTLGLVGITYSNPSDKIEALTLVRAKNSGKNL